MKHLKLDEKPCYIPTDHDRHDWWQRINRWGMYRMVAGWNAGDYPDDKHFWCPGLETRGRHKGGYDVELDSQTNRPEQPHPLEDASWAIRVRR